MRQSKALQDLSRVRQITDHPSQRRRRLFNQRRGSHDLLIGSEPRLLINIYNLEIVMARKMFFAYLLYVVDGLDRFRRGSTNVQPQNENMFALPGKRLLKFVKVIFCRLHVRSSGAG